MKPCNVAQLQWKGDQQHQLSNRIEKATPSRYGWQFWLFLTAIGGVLVRPSEIFSIFSTVNVVLALLILSSLASGILVANQLTPTSLRRSPITICVLGTFVATILSNTVHGMFYRIRDEGFEFLKVVILYLLLVGTLDTYERLNAFLRGLVGFILVVTVLALLQYHGEINIAALRPIDQAGVQSGGPTDGDHMLRLCGPGIFHDPNDMCLLLTLSMLICGFNLENKTFGPARWLWLMPMLIDLYALKLTFSRGGLIGVTLGAATLTVARVGYKRAILICSILFPLFLVVFAGRQTDLDLSNPEDSGLGRIGLWSEALTCFRHSPVFGIGQGNLPDELSGYVAHNSFIHAYAEIGFLGGTLFVGIFFTAMMSLWHVRSATGDGHESELLRFQPYAIAIVIAFVFGIFTLSRTYTVLPFMVPGIVMSWLNSTAALPGCDRVIADRGWLLRLFAFSAAVVIGMHVFVRLALN